MQIPTKTTVNNVTGPGSGGITGKGFMPGTSGNPNGRPPGPGLTSILRRELERVPQDDDPRSIGERIIEVAVQRALDGDFPFFKEILRRTEGLVSTQGLANSCGDEVIVIQLPAPGSQIAVGSKS